MASDQGAAPPPSPGEGLPLELSAEQLAQLAASQPELWAQIWHHPNSYDGLRQWISERAQEQRAALAQSTAPAADPLPKKRSTAALVIGGIAALALVLAGTGVALALSGAFGGGAQSGGNLAGDAPGHGQTTSFAQGFEKMWTAASDDYVTPQIAPDTAPSWLSWAPSRASIAQFSPDIPVATESAVVFNAVNQNESVLVMIEAATGEVRWQQDLGGGRANCVADEHAPQQTFLCVVAELDKRSQLLRIGLDGVLEAQQLDGGYQRVAVGEDRIVLALDPQGQVLALDRSLHTIWHRAEAAAWGDYGIDLGAERTLVRGGGGWALFDGDGRTLASAEVTNVYMGGTGYCDARLTPEGQLFVAVGGDDSCVRSEGFTEWWGFGENLSGTYLFSAKGAEYVLKTGDGSTRLLRFPAKGETRLESVLELDRDSVFHGHTKEERPILVLSSGGVVTSYSLENGAELASWPVSAGALGGLADDGYQSHDLVLDDEGTVLLGKAAYNAYTGEALWRLDTEQEHFGGWLTAAGMLQLTAACPSCSTAGGASAAGALTLYAPAGSGGAAFSRSLTGAADDGDATVAAPAPDFIPDCPTGTILLAWMELEDGWIVVCGVSADRPSYVAYTTKLQQRDGRGVQVLSLGASKPESDLALAAVTWDAAQQRYVADLADGSKLTLDYTTGMATLRDGQTNSKVTEQHRFVRYVFVPLGGDMRGESDSAGRSGAFDVLTPEATAEDQVRYMVEVLEKSYQGRAMVREALPKLQGCTAGPGGYADTIAAMTAVRDNRAELLTALDAMPVDRIPEGKQLLAELTEAISLSYQANVHYVAWAEAANASGCAALSAEGQSLAAASGPPKERFASLWNSAVAPSFGVRTFDAPYI